MRGTDDGAFLRFEFSAEQLHECGFAGAVGAGESVALAWGEGGGDFVEQNFGAVAHGNITDGKHDCGSLLFFVLLGFVFWASTGKLVQEAIPETAGEFPLKRYAAGSK